jgi:hypothetical protein
MKRLRSGIIRSASTARRSSRRKSPALAGRSSSARRRKSDENQRAAFAAHPVDDVAAGAPLGDQLADQLGRVLEVGVDRHHRVAAAVVDAGGDGRLVSEVARQLDHLHPRVLLGEVAQELAGPVGGAVVDQDELELDPVESRADALVEGRQHRLLVEHRGGDAQQFELALTHRSA